MRPGCWVSDSLLQVDQGLMLTVLLNAVVVDICPNINGCHLGDQVVNGGHSSHEKACQTLACKKLMTGDESFLEVASVRHDEKDSLLHIQVEYPHGETTAKLRVTGWRTATRADMQVEQTTVPHPTYKIGADVGSVSACSK